MNRNLLLLSVAVILLLLSTQARADFLGLSPGDYDVTLLNTSAFCVVDCVGKIHIPTGTVTTGNFHWNFQIGPALLFDWTHNLITSTSPNLMNTCAVESGTNATCVETDSNPPTLNIVGPALMLSNDQNGTQMFLIELIGGSVGGHFTATQVPEPPSVFLVMGALPIIWFWRRASGGRVRLITIIPSAGHLPLSKSQPWTTAPNA
jgi:hypothetical protein